MGHRFFSVFFFSSRFVSNPFVPLWARDADASFFRRVMNATQNKGYVR